MIYLPEKDFNDYKEMLMRKKYKFDFYHNNSSFRISGGISGDRFTGDIIEKKYLYFIAKVKNHVRSKIDSGELKPDLRIKFQIDYYHISSYRNKSFSDCYEVDINSAYWESAYRLGIISRKIYNEGNKITERSKDRSLSEDERLKIKAVRLMALGSLAKNTTHFKFDGKKMIRQPDIIDKQTEFFWNQICLHTSDFMKKCATHAGDDYLFYWVDAVFIKKGALAKIKKLIEHEGCNYKVKPVNKITFTKGVVRVDGKEFARPKNN